MTTTRDYQSEAMARLALVTIQQAADGIFWLNAEGRIKKANDAACRMLGYCREELLTMTVGDIDPAYSSNAYKILWQQIKQAGSYRLESRHLKKDKKFYPAEITLHFVNFEGTELACTFFRDITRRKEMETALRESERKLRAIINHHFQFTGLLSAEGRLIMANEPALHFIGVTEEEVKGRLFWETPWWTHSQKVNDELKRGLKKAGEGKFVRFETTHLNAHGQKHYVDFSLTPLLDENQRVQYLIPEARDITHIKKTEEELQQTLTELEKLKTRLQKENIYLKEEIELDHNFGTVIGRSKAFNAVLEQVKQVASTDTTVLILGETGTGKELIARAVHAFSKRKERPLVKVNCAALPANLIESELFGHEKGAFTGALYRKLGRFELADGGTIFLDEIGDLSLELQAKLLRVLQEGEIERLGGTQTLGVNVRVIAATNRNLEKLIVNGGFRGDLYYRLNVFPIHCPPLRDRGTDIALLAAHFVEKYAIKTGKKIKTIPPKALRALMAYHWPGNVRELENIIERALVISRGEALQLGDWFFQSGNELTDESEISTLEEVNRKHILRVLDKTSWRVSGPRGAAEKLGLKPTTLEARMKKLGIKRK